MSRILGVDIGGTDIKLGIVDEKGNILESGILETKASDGPEQAVERTAAWLGEHSVGGEGISAAGIDCAGLIDGERGYLYYSPNLPGWEKTSLGELFSRALGMPVTVDNDVNCAAWGEYVLGAGRGTKYFVCITLGTGIGGGVIADGRLYRGWQGMAGEVGHQVIDAAGPECVCGSKGCLEILANASSIVSRAREAIAAGASSSLEDSGAMTAKDVADAAAGGDSVALEALAGTGRVLGTGLANIVHLFNPEVIAVGGGVGGAGELILGPARESMRSLLMDGILAEVRVVPAELGNNAALVGAAMMALGPAD
jgi:glucokinase